MRRTLRPAVDQLEGKALLTGFVAPIHAPVGPVVPAGVTASVVVSAPTIAQGGSVTLSLIETNTTSSPVTISIPTSQEGFKIYERGIEVWTSNPTPFTQGVQKVTIAAGQSATLFSATWNDTSNVHAASLAGTFSVVNEFEAAAPPATVTVTPSTGSDNSNPPSTSPVFPKYPPKLHVSFG